MYAITNKFSSTVRCAIVFCLLVPVSHAGWEVTWIDRFDGNSVNYDNWTAQTQANYNNEIQCYTDDDSSANRNYEVSDGTLKITARRQSINCPGQNGVLRQWTSGRLNSKDKAEFLYGRVESRLRFNELKGGTWPAFWMLGNRIAEQPIKGDNDNINWPNPGAGEIDIWEWFSNGGDQYITNFYNVSNCGAERRFPYPGGAPSVSTFHTYAVEWTADNIKFFFNDQLVVEHDLSNCPQYEEPMFALLNVAVGGNLGGAVDPQLNTATMEVDYVARCVASDANSLTRCNESTPALVDDDNDGVRNSEDECPNTPDGARVDSVGCEIPTAPTEAAPTPTTDAAQTISIFSDAYSNIADVNYNPDWQQATNTTVIEVEGNATLKYENLNYQGTEFIDNPQDVTTMEFLNVDYWTSDATLLEIFLISPGPEETAFVVDIDLQAWQTLSIPLTTFTDVDLSDVIQLKVQGNGTVFLDNIYFSTQATSAETNVAPTVTLSASQGSANVSSANTTAGTVTVTADINDENTDDTHTLVWSVTGISTFETNNNQLTFSPAGLSVSQIAINVEVTDSGQPALTGEADISLNVVTPQAPPAPPASPESSSSGGSLNFLFLLGLLGISFFRRSKQ